MAQIIESIKSMTKKTIVATTALGVVVAGGIGWRVMQMFGRAGEEGAIVNLDERNGMMLTDLKGRPAFMKFFDGQNKNDLQLTLNVITDRDSLPSSLRHEINRYEELGTLPLADRLDPDEYHPIQRDVVPVMERFAREFEELTGIRINIVENSSRGADITVAGFTDDKTAGFASFPLDLPNVPGVYSRRSFMMLDVGDLQRRLDRGDLQAIQSLFAHELGHNLGLFHPHEGTPVDTAMSLAQQEAVSAMSYNDVTFPPVVSTDIATNYGPMDIFLLREAMRSQGIPLPRLNIENNNYLLNDLIQWQMENTHSKRHRPISQIPALSLLDNGGTNALFGTDGDDLLVTEAGYCGLIDRENETMELMKDGAPFCLVEGEFSIVHSGDGNDLILTANGTEQDVYLGTGNKDVALVHYSIGDKVIHTPDREADGETTLTIHFSVLERANILVADAGDDIKLIFAAPSGREVGTITLKGQDTGQGIDRVRIIDNDGEALFETEISEDMTRDAWYEEVAQPAMDRINDYTLEEAWRWHYEQAQQALAGGGGHWTDEIENIEAVVDESSGHVHVEFRERHVHDEESHEGHGHEEAREKSDFVGRVSRDRDSSHGRG